MIVTLGEVEGTVIAVSSDLSHYHDAATARRLDAHTIRQIALAGEMAGAKGSLDEVGALTSEQACGAAPLNGLLEVCSLRGFHPLLLGAHNSGDVPGGEEAKVVGYAAFAIEEDNDDASTT